MACNCARTMATASCMPALSAARSNSTPMRITLSSGIGFFAGLQEGLYGEREIVEAAFALVVIDADDRWIVRSRAAPLRFPSGIRAHQNLERGRERRVAFPVLEQIKSAGKGQDLCFRKSPAGGSDQAAVEEAEVE